MQKTNPKNRGLKCRKQTLKRPLTLRGSHWPSFLQQAFLLLFAFELRALCTVLACVVVCLRSPAAMGGDDERERLEHASAEEGDDAKPSAEEEDTGAEVAPIVRLDAVAVSTGEENEEALIDLKAKLYRFDKEGNQWKERGMGQVKLLKHKETEKVRLVMRQNKTLKICANHIVLPSMSLQEHQGSDKTWVWHASDFSEGELKDELFCIRFGSAENAQAFKKAFEDVQKAVSSKVVSSERDAEEVGELLEGLKVGGDKTDKKAEETEGKAEEAKEKASEKEAAPEEEEK